MKHIFNLFFKNKMFKNIFSDRKRILKLTLVIIIYFFIAANIWVSILLNKSICRCGDHKRRFHVKVFKCHRQFYTEKNAIASWKINEFQCLHYFSKNH